MKNKTKNKIKKIKLYHYSDFDFTGKIKTGYFASNSYTLNDKKSCGIDRAFFYLKNNPLEYIFKRAKFLYIIEVNPEKIYDLRQDKNKLINKNIWGGIVHIHNLLTEIKRRGYIGIIYKTCGVEIASIFEDKKISEKIRRF